MTLKKLSVIFILSVALSILMSACSPDDAEEGAPAGGDPDADSDWEWPYGDGDIEVPDEQPQPEGDPALDIVFGAESPSLSDWRVYDRAENFTGASDWTVMADGLKQFASMIGTAESDPGPQAGAFLSSELRYERRSFGVTAVELVFEIGDDSGGIGLSLADGGYEMLLCFDETECGGAFARISSEGGVLFLDDVSQPATGADLTLLATYVDGWLLVSIDGEVVAGHKSASDIADGAVGILDYRLEDLTVKSLKVWGDDGGERTPGPRGWKVIAHRGRGNSSEKNLFPENSIAAILQGLADGADHIEIDVHMTSDGVPVIIHDATLDRTSTCSGAVADMTWDEVGLCDAQDGSPWPGEAQTIPSLESAFDAAPDAEWFVELKSSGDEIADQELVKAVAELMVERAIQHKCWIISFDLEIVRYADVEASVNTAWVKTNPGGDNDAFLNEALGANVDAIDVKSLFLKEELVGAAHSEGLKVFTWTVDSQPEIDQLAQMNVDGITTNRPDRAFASPEWVAAE